MKSKSTYSNDHCTINLINGDSMEALKKMEENQFDLAIVDPPYGIKMDKANGKRSNGFQAYIHQNKNWDNEPPNNQYFDWLKIVTKEFILFGCNNFIRNINPEYSWIVWDKIQPMNTSFAMFELACYSGKSQYKIYTQSIASNNNRATNRRSAKKYERIHPTQKPVALYKWLLKNYAKEGDTILDTHGGSMSIALACWDMGYSLDLYEIDEDYYKAGVKRFEEHISKPQLFEPKQMYSKQLKI